MLFNFTSNKVATNQIFTLRFCITFLTSFYRDRTHTELNLLHYVNHQHYTSPSSKYRHQKGKKGWEEGGEGQVEAAGSCYWSKQSFINQIVPSKWSNNLQWGVMLSSLHYSAKKLLDFCVPTKLCIRGTLGYCLMIIGPRSSSLCSTILSRNRSWGQTLWKTAAFLFCSIHTRYFKTTIQRH